MAYKEEYVIKNINIINKTIKKIYFRSQKKI